MRTFTICVTSKGKQVKKNKDGSCRPGAHKKTVRRNIGKKRRGGKRKRRSGHRKRKR